MKNAMKSICWVLLTLVVAVVSVLPVSPLLVRTACAEEMTEAERKAAAREFLEQGVEAQEAGEHKKAIGFFTKADGIFPHPAHSYFMARSYLALGDVLYAKEAYTRFVLAEPDSDKMRELQQEAEAAISEIEPRIPKLTIQVREDVLDRVQVLIDGKVVPTPALNAPIPVNPGKHTISVESDAYELDTGLLELDIQEGATELVNLGLKAVVTRVGPPKSDGVQERPSKKSNRTLLIGGVTAVGVGAVGLVAGSVLLAQAGNKKSDWEDHRDLCVSPSNTTYCSPENSRELDDLTKKEESLRTGATVSLVVGGAALATGVTLLVLAKGKKEKPVARHIRPVVGVRSLGIQGRF